MLSTPELIMALAALTIAALLQGTVGFGYAILAVPLLRIIEPELVPVPLQLTALVITSASLIRERTHLNTHGVGWIFLGRLPGVIVGLWLLSSLPSKTLSIAIGLGVLLGVAAIARGWSVPFSKSTQIAAGFASGVSGTASGIGGPPLAVIYRDRTGPEVRSTMGAVFFGGLLLSLIGLGLAGKIQRQDLATAAALAPATLAGFLLSSKLRHRLQGEGLKRAILVVSTLAAVALLARTVTG